MTNDNDKNRSSDSNIFVSADPQGRVLMQIRDDVSAKVFNLRIAIDAVDMLVAELQAAKELACSLTMFVKPTDGAVKN